MFSLGTYSSLVLQLMMTEGLNIFSKLRDLTQMMSSIVVKLVFSVTASPELPVGQIWCT